MEPLKYLQNEKKYLNWKHLRKKFDVEYKSKSLLILRDISKLFNSLVVSSDGYKPQQIYGIPICVLQVVSERGQFNKGKS